MNLRQLGFILQVIGYFSIFIFIISLIGFLIGIYGLFLYLCVSLLIGSLTLLVGMILRPKALLVEIIGDRKYSTKSIEPQKVMKVIICTKCDAENDADSEFCKKCGSKLRKK